VKGLAGLWRGSRGTAREEEAVARRAMVLVMVSFILGKSWCGCRELMCLSVFCLIVQSGWKEVIDGASLLTYIPLLLRFRTSIREHASSPVPICGLFLVDLVLGL
jgi:hypothetical protein